jgi:hypothetical protein
MKTEMPGLGKAQAYALLAQTWNLTPSYNVKLYHVLQNWQISIQRAVSALGRLVSVDRIG